MLSATFQNWLGRATLVASDDVWTLFTVMVVSVALAIWLEQKYAWASKVSGAIVALIFALALSNLGIIPASCPLYDDIVWGYAVPMGIPLLMLKCDLKTIWRDTGRMLTIFMIGAAGTVVGALLGYSMLRDAIPELAEIAAMMTGSYIGGGVNFAAMAAQFHVSEDMIGAATVADNLLMAVYFFVLILFAGLRAFRDRYPHPDIDAVTAGAELLRESKTQAAAFWKPKPISLRDIAFDIAYTVAVVWISRLTGAFFGGAIPDDGALTRVAHTFLSSQYVWITTYSVAFATFCGGVAKRLHGAQEIGTFLIYMFLFVIGVPASVAQIVREMPLLFAFTLTMVIVNMLFCFVGGKLLGFGLEEIILASNANIGGPTTAAGMAISQGWSRLVGAAMLTGTFGYIIGNYAGVIVGSLLGTR